MMERVAPKFYEIHVTVPRRGEYEGGTDVYGPYETERNVKLALTNNRRIDWRIRHMGGTVTVKKIHRTYSDVIEEVEL